MYLTRRCGESIDIGPDVVIRVLAINGKFVKIGIDAPMDVLINRTELGEKGERLKIRPNDDDGDVGMIEDRHGA